MQLLLTSIGKCNICLSTNATTKHTGMEVFDHSCQWRIYWINNEAWVGVGEIDPDRSGSLLLYFC